ncbi:uncharacterized protein LOC106761528 [Vigna radiata var. radiata]|uniref:Uncharacterized protein LOC106761528 n=1 Tax=Vigna radiata var. radiata TaxID=3916 RepID=A0A1S3U3H2_VIGRR|nr:uncharacterized protein LOC106761528 [Vigna radiata var. radiata]
MTETNSDPTTNPSSPYYLHPGENPGITLISQILTKSNYSSWSRNLKRALLSKNKVKFIDGSIQKPTRTDKLFEAWERCDTMVLSWIIKTLSPQIADSVLYADTAQELWEELKDHFSKGDYFKISDLLQDIHSIKQGERNISHYYTDLKILWEELESLRPIPTCTCPNPCTCDLSKISLRYREAEHVICFLKGLNDTYQTVRTQILLMEPLPNINKVFSLLIQQERQYQDRGGTNDTFKILASTVDKTNWRGQGRGTNSRGQGRGRGRNPNYGKQCSHCHKMNHTIDECYPKHGFPPWYKKNDNQNSQDRGHNEWSYANACKEDSNSTQTQSAQQEKQSNPMQGFTPEQMQKLLQIIENTQTQNIHSISQVQRNTPGENQGTFSWIIDTGATDHVTHEKKYFITFQKIKPITVKLPNNSVVTAQYAGTIQFSENFIIFNVLYIPEFSFNLISVQSLTRDLNCVLTFSSKSCQIQDSSTLKMIGHAKVLKGLYYLQSFPVFTQYYVPKAVLSCKHVNDDLWLPTPVLKGKTPYDLMYNTPPTYLNLKTFGCLCFASTLEHNRHKLDSRARKGVFLGYKNGVKGYVILNVNTREIFLSRNVVFHENVFPYKDQQDNKQNYTEKEIETVFPNNFWYGLNCNETQDYLENINTEQESDHRENPNTDIGNSHTNTDNSPRRPTRTKRVPGYLNDYIHQVN